MKKSLLNLAIASLLALPLAATAGDGNMKPGDKGAARQKQSNMQQFEANQKAAEQQQRQAEQEAEAAEREAEEAEEQADRENPN